MGFPKWQLSARFGSQLDLRDERHPNIQLDVLGVEFLEESESGASARVEIRDELLQPFGLLHGGVYGALAEEWLRIRPMAGSPTKAWRRWASRSRRHSCGRPPTGYVTAVGTVRHRGRTTWVWDVDLSDDEGRLLAVSRVTIAVRPAG